MDKDGVLRHLAFFEELGRMEDTDASWRSVSAGLVAMRLVDSWIADGPTASRVESWGVSAVREAIAQMVETTPIKRILTSVVDVMVSSTAIDMHALCPRLMAYGQALEYEAKWSLAADVYATIVAHAHPVEDSDLAVAAHLQLAFCLRTSGQVDDASVAYQHAATVANASGDLIGLIRAHLGDAKIAMARGNMPKAESILDETIERARSHGLHDVQASALTDRALLAGVNGQYERAVRYSYQALEVSTNPRDRDRALSNVATGFRYLGLLDAARDAYLVLASTAQEQYIRWMAEVNLMELAADQGVEIQFDKYRRDLESAGFTPQLRVTYLLHVGRGYHALGKSDTGIAYLERAVDFAAEHGLNQLLFEAESALVEARRGASRQKAQAVREVSGEVWTVVEAVHGLRSAAGIA